MTDVSLGLAGSFAHGRVISELLAPDDLAAGVPFAYPLTGSYWERPVSLSFVLSAGADDTVTDVQVLYTDGNGIPIVTVETGPALDASTSAAYSFLASQTAPAFWSNDVVNAPLPPILLQPTWNLTVSVVGGWTEGQFTDVRFYRERFITGPGGYEIGVQQDEQSNEQLLQKLADRLA